MRVFVRAVFAATAAAGLIGSSLSPATANDAVRGSVMTHGGGVSFSVSEGVVVSTVAPDAASDPSDQTASLAVAARSEGPAVGVTTMIEGTVSAPGTAPAENASIEIAFDDELITFVQSGDVRSTATTSDFNGKDAGFFVVATAETADGEVVPADIVADGNELSVQPDWSALAEEPTEPVTVQVMAADIIVSSVTKVYSSANKGWIWKVKPTAAGRVAAEWIHISFGWPQAKSQGVPNYEKLFEQYLCHPLSQVARVKPTWNLDGWRPNVSMAATMAAACNP